MSGRTAVAMSGGVDSAVAAALIREREANPFGVTMRLFSGTSIPASGGLAGNVKSSGCCGGEDAEIARAAAQRLGIPFYVLDLEDEFRRWVVDDMVRSYRLGRTPLPCAACNHRIKFACLFERVLGMGAERLATGHYARLGWDPVSERHILSRGIDAAKDQSYFLFGLTQEMLSRVQFPLGGLTKEHVRCLARKFHLPNAEKPESQDLCFVPGGDYRRFVEGFSSNQDRSGEIVDGQGRVLARHRGVFRFTVGQRRGLDLPGRERRYVVRIDAAGRRVIVGSREETYCTVINTGCMNWVSRRPPRTAVDLEVQVRHRHPPVPARITPQPNGGVRIDLSRPVAAPAPGQAAVLYDRNILAGGGWIEMTESVQPNGKRPKLSVSLPSAVSSAMPA
ncbi:MAG: tRNA 2-thiouridine(34) synthase MnmA [Acidobacteriota bacterium]